VLDGDGHVVVGCVGAAPYLDNPADGVTPNTARYKKVKRTAAANGETKVHGDAESDSTIQSDGPSSASAAAAASPEPEPEPANPSTTPNVELKRMCVDPRMHRSGVASKLIRHLESWAAAEHYSYVFLTTLASMRAATGLYQRNGYTFIGPPEGVPLNFFGDTLHPVALGKPLPVSKR
jgi:GNAT superfamily N-acetyltransferase